jgi:DNA primase
MNMCEYHFDFVQQYVPFNDTVKYYLRVVAGQKVTKHKVYSAYCPWCDEPRMRVNPLIKSMFCDECGAGGDVIAVVSKSEDETPIETALRLVDKYDIQLDRCTDYECRGTSSVG